jgi:dihydrofolate synthase/folylpolyglutamate synthase
MFGLPKFGDGIGLARIARFYREHAVDEHWLSTSSIVVVGSNGKGSTSRFTQALLGVGGKRIGLFTSPHMFDYRERFLIGEDRIAPEAFDRHAGTVRAFNDSLAPGDKLGGFEFLFLVAVLWFREEKPDAIVWEAGIGGRYDPVRTLQSHAVGLTAVELEHTQLLGPTEELIAYDKIDALAPGGRLVVSPAVPADLRQRIVAHCGLAERTAFFVGDALRVSDVANAADGVRFRLNAGATVRLGLIGRHQIDNALTALTLARAFRGQADKGAPDADAMAALAATRWPGRLEKVASNPDLWIDVGHTPRALELVTEAFTEFAPRERTLVVFGVSASKEVGQIARVVASRFDHFVLTQAHKAGADPAGFAEAFADKDVYVEPNLARAVKRAKARAAAEGFTVLALGGLFLAAEVQRAWEGGDPGKLEFF